MNTTLNRPRIFSHLTRTRFLHIEDALVHGKIRFFIGSFERGKGSNGTAYAFMDVEDARVIFHDLAWGKPIDFVDHKGGKENAGRIIARVVKIKTKDTQVWLQVQNSPGRMAQGAIQSAGQPEAEISIPLTIFEGRKMGYAVLAYLQAWEVKKVISNQ